MKKIVMQIPELPYALEEAYNRLRVNIKFCGENTRKILVTSSVPNEGKSTASFNLWRLLAEAGFRTTLVDTDLRKSVMPKTYFPDVNKDIPGIGHYLSGQAEIEDCMYATNIKNGYIVPCTGNIQNPSSLFEEPRFKEMLDSLSDVCRYVIVDSPPLYNVADAAQIAGLCDGSLLIVRAGFTPKKIIRQSLNQLELTGCPVLGTVLNFVETGTGKYGKYKKYGKYGYYYKKYDYRKYDSYYGDGNKGSK